MKKYLFYIAICIFIFGCKTKKEVIQSVKKKEVVLDNSCSDRENDLSWTEYVQDDMDSKIELNNLGKLLNVNSNYLRSTMIKNFQTESFAMTFPLLINGVLECKKFELESSNTLSKEKQKMMKIFSFRGVEAGNQENTIRVDYSVDNGLKVYAFMNGGSYLLEPVSIAGKRMYITYDKKDSGEFKEQFNIND